MSSDGVKGAVLLAFAAGAASVAVLAPLLVESITTGYDDGLLRGIWLAALVGWLLVTVGDALDKDDGDSDGDGVEDRGMEERL